MSCNFQLPPTDEIKISPHFIGRPAPVREEEPPSDCPPDETDTSAPLPDPTVAEPRPNQSRFAGRVPPVPEAPRNRAFRRTSQLKPLPNMMPVDIASVRIKKVMKNYLDAVLERFQILENRDADRDNRRADGRPDGPRLPPPPHIPPLGIMATPGTGKSEQTKEILRLAGKCGVPILLVCHDHEALKAYETLKDGTPTGMFHYHGRRAEGEHGVDPWTCYEYGKTIALAEKNHWAAQNLCRDKCGYGQAWKARQGGEMAQEAHEWFVKNHKRMSDYKPCEWQSHNASARSALVVGISWQSYSEFIATYYPPGQRFGVERLVIIDEEVPLGYQVSVEYKEMLQWRGNCEEEIARLSSIDFKSPEKATEAARQIAGLKEGIVMCQTLMDTLTTLTGKGNAATIHQVPASLRETMHTLKRRTVGMWTNATATWERVRFNGLDVEGDMLPRRATAAIISTLAHEGGYFKDGQLHVIALTGAGEDIVRGRSAIILDATMPIVVQKIIEAKGGRIERIFVKQNVKVFRYPNRLHGRGKGKSDDQKDHEKTGITRAIQSLDLLPAGRPSVVITHLNWLKPLYEEQKQRPNDCQLSELAARNQFVGHLGFHDKARNDFEGFNMSAFGGPILHPKDQRKAYTVARMTAILAGIDETEWPQWADDEDTEEDVWIDEGSGFEVKCQAPLPCNTEIRRWVLDNYTGKAVQRLGRPRAVWASADDPIIVVDFGGLPIDWAAWGIRISEYRDGTELGWKTGPETQHDDAQARFSMAVSRLRERGEAVSKKRIIAELDAMKGAGLITVCVSPRLVGAWWAELKAARPQLVERVTNE